MTDKVLPWIGNLVLVEFLLLFIESESAARYYQYKHPSNNSWRKLCWRAIRGLLWTKKEEKWLSNTAATYDYAVAAMWSTYRSTWWCYYWHRLIYRNQNSVMTREARMLPVCQCLCLSSHPAHLIRGKMRGKSNITRVNNRKDGLLVDFIPPLDCWRSPLQWPHVYICRDKACPTDQ